MVIKQAEIKLKIKNAAASLDQLALKKYGDITEEDVKDLAIRGKWFKAIESAIDLEIEGLLSILIERVRVASERYDTTLHQVSARVKSLELEVENHLKSLGVL
jgi:type I restriction enzyme M protein